MLRDEVLKQRNYIQELENNLSLKTNALTSLSDFFKTSTLAKVKEITRDDDATTVVSSTNDGSVKEDQDNEASEKSLPFNL